MENYNRKFGAVFTPLSWAKEIVAKHFFAEWLAGATILDPTAGEGVFFEAFISLAKANGIEVSQNLLSRLFGIELNTTFVDAFFTRIKSQYGIKFPKENFRQGDIFFQENEIRADILVGNPPWVNFTDLDENYKEKIKPLFSAYGLAGNLKDLLLGNARTDIAALVLAKVIHDNLKENGRGVFFLPLSIFQNDGANKGFRKYRVKEVDFCVEEIRDFNGERVFEDIRSRYGIATFHRDKKQDFPINYQVLEEGKWKNYKARPLFESSDPLTVIDDEQAEIRFDDFKRIVLPKHLKPRQGVNTCGTNDIFFFPSYRLVGNDKVELKSRTGERITVNAKYVFPLTVSSTLRHKNPQPEKLILIPHNENGKPLDYDTLRGEEELYRYLYRHKQILENRKGVLINSWIGKGYWWALMGIGKYSFAPYKVMWKAFGDSYFSPRLLLPDTTFGSWQGNQSLNAFIGAATLEEAEEICGKLANPAIQDYLSSMRMQGTCNWAQPGRIKKLMEFV